MGAFREKLEAALVAEASKLGGFNYTCARIGASSALRAAAEEIDRKLDIWDDDAAAKPIYDWLRSRAEEVKRG